MYYADTTVLNGTPSVSVHDCAPKNVTTDCSKAALVDAVHAANSVSVTPCGLFAKYDLLMTGGMQPAGASPYQ